MATRRKVFYSFHYDRDSWRVQQVKNMGVVEGQRLLSSNDWEEVKKKGDAAIKEWIATEMKGKSCLVVLIGSETAGRPWVRYEIQKAWTDGKGVLGVDIHHLKNKDGKTDTRGANPFAALTLNGTAFSDVARRHNPAGSTSSEVYASIEASLPSWVEEAIAIRSRH